jgi:cell division protease FtsH
MSIEAWLPIGHELPDGTRCGKPLYGGHGWQIVMTAGGGRALLADEALHSKWVTSRIIDDSALKPLLFGSATFHALSSAPSKMLAPINECRSPNNKAEALSFALALKATRETDAESPLQDAIYVEPISRLLPTYTITSRVDDDVLLGFWLTGGARVSAKAGRRLSQMLSWMGSSNLTEVVSASGVMTLAKMAQDDAEQADLLQTEIADAIPRSSGDRGIDSDARFSLPGRPMLEEFFNEHIIDIIRNEERYAALGVGFPSAVALHGPPGCGKTFAVEQLVEFLGWPSFQIDASSVASPYIHETSKKIAEIFDKAMRSAPSVLIIDEMESFLADREAGSGGSHHRVEEVAEFLRRIPEAGKNHVLVVGMTNRIEMIDSAIMRRGRFDHVIEVPPATEEEVSALLDKLLSDLPKDSGVDQATLAKRLAGRPLSDVAFVVREGARLSARAGKFKIDQAFLLSALDSAPSRADQGQSRRIGFV